MWSSHMQRILEWRHPLRQSLLEMGENAPERLTNYCMMHERMWDSLLLSVNRGGHPSGTLVTLPSLGSV